MDARTLVGIAFVGSLLSACSVLTPLPKPTGLQERLDVLPRNGIPVSQPVTIRWNDYQVPFIEAATDADLAVSLGYVHAHLRWAQMELLRHVAEGRLSEMVGPLATDIDHSLRILDFGRSVPATLAEMPQETLDWLEAFVQGVNYYIEAAPKVPHEFSVLGLEREPWTVADVLTIGRLASVDVNWILWFEVLKLRDRPDWPEIWQELVQRGSESATSFDIEAGGQQALLKEMLTGLSRSGSNSIAVSGEKSGTGSALMANDPHLGIFLPNAWLLAGIKSPSYHAVGMMIPGLPFVALGRNPWIAWGGTNLRSASSDLYDVSGVPEDSIESVEKTIGVRWWFDKTIEVRYSPYGPIISDVPLLDLGENTELALRWTGHLPSDEVTAMLNVNKARNWEEFRSALADFHVPGQNMLYADAEGHIGQVLAVKLPRRSAEAAKELVLEPGEPSGWDDFVTATELPSRYDPPQGFLASANNRPVKTDIPIGFFFSSDDRITRLRELLSAPEAVTVDRLKEIQRDVYMSSAAQIRDALAARVGEISFPEPLSEGQRNILDLIAGWHGHYRRESKGALAFEIFIYHFHKALYDERRLAIFDATSRKFDMLRDDIMAADAAPLARAIDKALRSASEDIDGFSEWGEMHRLRMAHPLSNVPVIGGRYRFSDEPVAGSTATVMKTAHGLTNERHATRYGSQARHISDMADIDANYFVLLGGQDGWINSANFLDQYELWREGRYVQMPLGAAKVRELFTHTMTLMPAGSG